MKNNYYSMVDVLNILGIDNSKKEILIDCPYCGKRKKMGINTIKGVYNCPHCQAKGSPLQFYTYYMYREDFMSLDKCRKREIIEEVKNSLGYGGTVSPVFKGNKTNNHYQGASHIKKEKYDYTNISKVYAEMFRFLKLSNKHRKSLNNRGLSDMDIDRLGYVSFPENPRILISHLVKNGFNLNEVPGFYFDTKLNEYRLSFLLKGIMIPIRNSKRDILSIQIRLDKPFENGTKYIYFSSSSKENGKGAISYVHLVEPNITSTMYLIEGVLKSDIAYALNFNNCKGRCNIVAVAGVNATTYLPSFLKKAKEKGLKKLIIAFDSDKYSNYRVLEAEAKILEMAESVGIESYAISWNTKYKGADDLAKAIKERV